MSLIESRHCWRSRNEGKKKRIIRACRRGSRAPLMSFTASHAPGFSDLCSPAFTATQYALLSSLASVGRTLVASSGGVLAERLGWAPFFLLTTVATLPALVLLLWISRRDAAQPD